MKIFGFITERSRGRQVGSMESAIINLQARVDKLEARREVRVKEVQHEEVAQGEIAKILQGSEVPGVDMWAGLGV